MGKTTAIEWTDHTFNPWWGCEKVSPACDHCYAWMMDKRFKPGGEKHWGAQAPRRFFGDAHWDEPLKWDRAAKRDGVQRRVFCGSMCDVMETHNDMDTGIQMNRERKRLWKLIEDTPHLIWMLLTKRPEGYGFLLPEGWQHEPRPNVWLMTTVESQEYIGRLHEMLKVPAVQYGISAEPLLGELDLTSYLKFENVRPVNPADNSGISMSVSRIPFWVIAGGESGPNARPSNPEWFRSVRDKCVAARVPFFFKQWGEYKPVQMQQQSHPIMSRVGKKAAGRLLDGRTWDQFPESKTP